MTDAPHTFRAPAQEDHALPDPDLAPVSAAEGSLLEELREELTAELDELMDPLEVPERPGFAVVYSKNVPNPSLRAWTRRAKDGKNVDALRLACIILGNQVRRIERRGVTVTAGGDQPVTFATPAFLELYGAGTAAQAIQRFYGLDGHVIAAANAVIRAAGYLDELDELDADADPTPAS